jgi:hypothetical protein
MGALVVGCSDSLKPFLASSVPNLQLNLLAINLNRLDLKVNTNRGHKIVCEHVVRKSDQ